MKQTPLPEWFAGVAEHHLDDVDGGAQGVRDAFVGTVGPGPVTVPRSEDRRDGVVELLAGVLGEVAARLRSRSTARNSGDQSLEGLGGQMRVVHDPAPRPGGGEQRVEGPGSRRPRTVWPYIWTSRR